VSAVAGKSDGEIQYPSSALVKNLNILAAALGIASIVLDAAVPIAQQIGKKKEAKEGLERAISTVLLLAVIRTVPRLIRETRKLRAQMNVRVAGQ
jgi:hypothetical protein